MNLCQSRLTFWNSKVDCQSRLFFEFFPEFQAVSQSRLPKSISCEHVKVDWIFALIFRTILRKSFDQISFLFFRQFPLRTIRILAEPIGIQRALDSRTEFNLIHLIATTIQTLGSDCFHRCPVFHAQSPLPSCLGSSTTVASRYFFCTSSMDWPSILLFGVITTSA